MKCLKKIGLWCACMTVLIIKLPLSLISFITSTLEELFIVGLWNIAMEIDDESLNSGMRWACEHNMRYFEQKQEMYEEMYEELEEL